VLHRLRAFLRESPDPETLSAADVPTSTSALHSAGTCESVQDVNSAVPRSQPDDDSSMDGDAISALVTPASQRALRRRGSGHPSVLAKRPASAMEANSPSIPVAATSATTSNAVPLFSNASARSSKTQAKLEGKASAVHVVQVPEPVIRGLLTA